MNLFRYPTQLEKALEDYLEDLRRQNDEEMTEDDQSSRVQWVMEFVSIALSGVKSQVRNEFSDWFQRSCCIYQELV